MYFVNGLIRINTFIQGVGNVLYNVLIHKLVIPLDTTREFSGVLLSGSQAASAGTRVLIRLTSTQLLLLNSDSNNENLATITGNTTVYADFVLI